MNKIDLTASVKLLSLFTQLFAKGSRSMITAFLLLFVLISASGCEDSGIVGGGLDQNGDKVTTTEVEISNLTLLSENGFSGRLGNTGMGIVDDPIFGSVWSAALLKPAISQENLDEFDSDSKMFLRLELTSLKYGEENSTSEYYIYEADQRWRGNELTYNNLISYDESNLIGSFTLSDETTKDVELSEEWVERYREFFNSESADRDSLYNREFPGIAIVPADDNEKIDFLRHRLTSEEEEEGETSITRFRIENEEDSLFVDMPLRDWGASMERTQDAVDEEDTFVMHNTFEKLIELELDLDQEQFAGQDIINVQLVFFVDEEPEMTKPAGFARPNPALLRYHVFSAPPLELGSELFTRGPTSTGTLNTQENFYQLNITNYVLNDLFGEAEATPLYITLQNNNGLLYSSRFFNENGPSSKTPRLIISTINPDN